MIFQNANSVFEYYHKLIPSIGIDFDNTKALFNQVIHIRNPLDNEIVNSKRKWNKTYADREWSWYLSGNRSVKEIKKFAPIWDKMHNGDDLVWSNYGFWWNIGKQMEIAVNRINEKPDTRKAIIGHFDPKLVSEMNKDMPCNLIMNFYCLGNSLDLTIMARSIDLWYGFCNDQYMFSKVMQMVAHNTNKQVGAMHYFITNLHLYNDKL